ncbi:type II secretion system F family protein [Azospirillum sp. TSO5]|uniref:type II secretion system F family protein n=1 Tax=Azospirillum sp. TSO5 TaxID=716760 RepID=UPI000D620D64|nr:type II secretion system F family protein [Azospirillum sp. TSO5]PWC92966.1 hypothetical protein TSO5_16190 [Azospirillum sp. TSO5]
MALWTVSVSSAGGIRKVKVQAGDRAAALKSASSHGRPLSASRDTGGGLFSAGMSETQRAIFLERLAALSASRIGVSKALEAMRDTMPGRVGQAAGLLLESMRSGMAVPAAMEANPKDFPRAVAAIVRAGMETGSLEKALLDAAEFERAFGEVRSGSGRGLMLAGFNIALAGTLCAGAKPAMDMLMSQLPFETAKPDADIAMLLSVSEFVAGALVSLAVGSILLMTFLWLLGGIGKRLFPLAADALIVRIPFYRDIALSLQNHVSLYQLSLLLRSGVRLEYALTLTAEAAPRGAMKRDLLKAADAVRSGRPWAECLRSLHATDRLAVSASSDRERMAHSLEAVSRQYKSAYVRRLAAAVPLMKTVAFLLMAGATLIVGFETTVPPLLMVKAVGGL